MDRFQRLIHRRCASSQQVCALGAAINDPVTPYGVLRGVIVSFLTLMVMVDCPGIRSAVPWSTPALTARAVHVACGYCSAPPQMSRNHGPRYILYLIEPTIKISAFY